MKRAIAGSIGLLSILLLGYLFYVAKQIERESKVEEAHPADVIIVLGAAEYRGKPSPVLQAPAESRAASVPEGASRRTSSPPAARAATRFTPKAKWGALI